MRLIVGLGNPGTEYVSTRHNIGWETIDMLVDRLGLGRPQEKFGGACWGPASLDGERVYFLKPYTYMNNSGIAVREIAHFYKIAPRDILVVVDDINLAPGRMRLRVSGSAGGHNGLKSIIAHLGTQDFPRLRLGVGERPVHYDLADWVLGHFSSDDRKTMDRVLDKASGFCLDWCRGGLTPEKLMSRINGCNLTPEKDGEA